MPKLVVFRGDAVESEFHLAGRRVKLGRDPANDIVLDDSLKGVSRFHAEVRAEGGTYFIVDVKSRNGVWINGRRIKEKAALVLGVPVTVGAYELVLEDDVSSGEYSDGPPVLNPPTVVSSGSAVTSRESSRSAARERPPRSPMTAEKRQGLVWSAAAVALLLACGVTFAVIRYRPWQTTTVAPVDPPSPPETPASLPPAQAIDDPRKEATQQQLAAARARMDDHDYAGALRDNLLPLLELDPDNQEALDLKRQAEAAVSAIARAPKPPPPPTPTEQPVPVETPGVPKRANEAWVDYSARVRRVQIAFTTGKASLDRQEFAAALSNFRLVERDQPKYQGVDLLITEALAKQQKAFDDAIGSGQQSEQASNWHDARLWYLKALSVDPDSLNARDRNAAVLGRMNDEATKLFNTASFNRKAGNKEAARKLFQQIVEMMLPGDEIRTRAERELEALKK